MGGIGSGNRLQWASKASINGFLSIDVRRLARQQLLRDGSSFKWQWSRHGQQCGDITVLAHENSITLKYRSRVSGDEWADFDYRVNLETTPCHLGGERVWFLCPARGCGRRVAKLYGGSIFACRTCHNINYPSQNESGSDRSTRRAERIRKRLNWPAGIFNGSSLGRPKGMHRSTYYRLVKEHDRHADQSMQEILLWLEKLDTSRRLANV